MKQSERLSNTGWSELYRGEVCTLSVGEGGEEGGRFQIVWRETETVRETGGFCGGFA